MNDLANEGISGSPDERDSAQVGEPSPALWRLGPLMLISIGIGLALYGILFAETGDEMTGEIGAGCAFLISGFSLEIVRRLNWLIESRPVSSGHDLRVDIAFDVLADAAQRQDATSDQISDILALGEAAGCRDGVDKIRRALNPDS